MEYIYVLGINSFIGREERNSVMTMNDAPTAMDDNIDHKNQDTDDGFRYPRYSKNYRRRRSKDEGGSVQILKRGASSPPCTNKPEVKTLEIDIDPSLISILIGTKGRNISLLCKNACVASSIEGNSKVVFSTKSAKSDLELAHNMMISMVSGGVVRWFGHPDATNKYYHHSVRDELENLVSATSECTLELLRAHNGHLCLMMVPVRQANKDFVVEQIRNLRPILLEKIVNYARVQER